jgi:DNA polymerase-3 subunit delta
MIYLLHGPEELIAAERVLALRAALGPPELAALSTTRLDGRRTSITEICHHCDAIPFLTPRRLVIVDDLLAHLAKRASSAGRSGQAESGTAALDSLLAYLTQLPETSDLVLVERDRVDARSRIFRAIAQLARDNQAEIVLCDAPQQRNLPDWIIKRVQSKGGQIERTAAQDLAAFVGRHMRLLDNELDKLVAYRGDDGPIRQADVRRLVPYVQEANIFDMVDAIGQQDSASALRLLRELERDGAVPLYLLSMIVRQFRILVQVSDQMARGFSKQQIAKNIGLHPYPTEKAMGQSRNWRSTELTAAYDRLLATDLAIKTGKMPEELALDLLVVELSQRHS